MGELGFSIPSLLDRIKAAVVDLLMVILGMWAASGVFETMEDVPNWWRILFLLFIWVLYEPIFVAFLGGTIGHLAMKLRVRRFDNPKKKIFILFALVRFALKSVLGILSFFTIHANPCKQAIHDLAVQAVVLKKK